MPNNFETDLLFPLIKEAAFMAGIEYGAVAKDDVLYRTHKPPSPSAFMLKPFTEGELINRIEALLDQMP